jgi:aminopeptidase-like protein
MLRKWKPQLGKRGLYEAIGGHKDVAGGSRAMAWVLNSSAGAHSLVDVAERSNLPFAIIWDAAEILRQHRLLFGRDADEQLTDHAAKVSGICSA